VTDQDAGGGSVHNDDVTVDRAADESFMRRALALAPQGWGHVSPNPLVGAVVVKNGSVVGEGAHREFGSAHAEVHAMGRAGPAARGATLYVTLEPCTHFGKTPPCVDAIIGAGLKRVVVGARDPNPAAGGGIEKLREAGIAVEEGVLEDESSELIAPFLHSFRSDRPWITLKLAVSRDGSIAGATREPRWLTGEGARRRVHHLRAGSDAIAVGMKTVIADDPLLTVRDADPPRIRPLRVVFSRTGRLPLTSRLAQGVDEAPVLVFAQQPDESHAVQLRALGVDVVKADLASAMRELKVRGVQSVLVEGGANLAAALLEAGFVDRLVLFQSPTLLGPDSLPAFGSLAEMETLIRRSRQVSAESIGDDRMLVLAPEGR
jgi:diaminohydroxyphosphoribosylaminopyrimidine deaminase/5-amino-6-(5-phosphoribosylamino)uracil reductase